MPKRMHERTLSGRPREKLLKSGPRKLTDFELLEVMVGSGTRQTPVGQIALRLKRTVERAGLCNLTVATLTRLPGLSVAKSTALVAAIEFVRRHTAREGASVQRAEDVLPFVTHIRRKQQEYFLLITLDGADCILGVHTVAVGTLTATLVHPREVFAPAIEERAASVILVHNHPSGSLEPSTEDKAVTNLLVRAGALLDIPVCDHIIVTRHGFYSFAMRGLLPAETADAHQYVLWL